MSFFYRVFSTLEKNIWASEIENYLLEKQLGLSVCGVVEEDDADNLEATPVELIFYDSEDQEVASLVYDNVQTCDFLVEEVEEFQGYVDEMVPICNREWGHDRLSKTVGCYCFTVMKAGFEDSNWESLGTLASWLRDETAGIEQSDNGQITNEEGNIILLVPDMDDEEESEGEDSVEFDPADELDYFDVDESDEIEEFEAAIRADNKWLKKLVNSEEALNEFMRGVV